MGWILLVHYFSIVLLIIADTQFYLVDAQMQELSSNGYTPGQHGERCLYPSQCDTNAKLLCIDGFCRCSSEYEMYDTIREQCAIREGYRCSPPKFLFGENNPCVSNAYCSESRRICECASHAFPDRVKGGCTRKKLYNDSCSASAECDDLKYLSCVDGRCSCRLSAFDEYHQICRRKVGDACTRTKDCVTNSECLQFKCVCNQGFSETSAKTCGLSFAKPCGGGDDDVQNASTCSDIYFACVNGECRCKNPSYEVFDNQTGICLSLVGGLCHMFLPSNARQPLKLKNCVQNSECIRRDSSPLSQCECVEGFVETLSGHCRLPHGSLCAVPGQIVQECAEPLMCKNMRCECQNENDIYDPAMKICGRIVGSICSTDNNECTTNSECVNSRCKCSLGFLPTFRGECFPETQSNPGIGPTGNPIHVLDPPPLSFNNDINHHYHQQSLSFQK